MAALGKPLGRGLGVLRALTRWTEWYDQKLPMFLAAICYAAIIRDRGADTNAWQIASLLVLFCLYAAFGHLVNDYADRDADRRAGKAKVIATLSEATAIAVVLVPLAGTVAVALASFGWDTVLLTVAALALSAVYSLPPLRLKTRGISGLVASTVAQRTAPLAIAFQALDAWGIGPALMLALGTCIGLRFIVIHQLHDRENDQRAGIRTFATEHSPSGLASFASRVIFPAEIASACLMAVAISYSAPFFALPFVLYLAKFPILLVRGFRLVILTYGVFSDFYCIVLPIGLAILLAADTPRFFWLVPLAVAISWQQIRTRAAPLIDQLRKSPRPGAIDEKAGAATPASDESRSLVLDKADPYPLYARLRARGAVHYMMWPDVGRTWIITRHHEALSVMLDPRFVHSAPRRADASDPVRGFGRDMLESDPPDHTRLRRLVGKAFTRQSVDRFGGRIEQLANQILDGAERRGSIELVSEYATVIPITIITELLGIPVKNIPAFSEFMYALTLSQMVGRRDEALEKAKLRFTNRLQGLFEQRRQEPRDDLLSALVAAESDGDKLSADELLGMAYLLLLAGFITTVNLIGNAVLVLLRHPDQLALLRAQPALAESAVEEVLRFESPLELSSVRFAAVDVELGDQRIPQGAAVRILVPSVNRDAERFPEPDQLDIRRNPCPHLTFGHGIHFCLGAPLARLDGRIALRTLVERSPGLRLADPAQVKWRSHPILRGLERLPLQL
jgi:cytochrome P450/4-hydroxybenzoate polyprenyltransferase